MIIDRNESAYYRFVDGAYMEFERSSENKLAILHHDSAGRQHVVVLTRSEAVELAEFLKRNFS